jgi:hypothetical protein
MRWKGIACYGAVAATIALGSLLGRKQGLSPEINVVTDPRFGRSEVGPVRVVACPRTVRPLEYTFCARKLRLRPTASDQNDREGDF